MNHSRTTAALHFLAAGVAVAVAAAAVGACGKDGGVRLSDLAPGRQCSLSWGPAERVGSLPGERKEVSGFVASAGQRNVAWMVRDSGNPAVLYSFEVDQDGKVTSREFPVKGVTNGDWEDLTYTTDDGNGRLWVLDNISRDT
ncbi:MAG: hypothetical protein ACRDV9_07980, partial [Acidimicrobiia bacterium]